MLLGRRLYRLRVTVPIILLIMILMRLVWMQLRTYPVQFEPRALLTVDVLHNVNSAYCAKSRLLARATPPLFPVAPETLEKEQAHALHLAAVKDFLVSPAYGLVALAACQNAGQDEHFVLKLNQIIFMMTIFCATLMTRFICSSWTVALVVAAMLLSRGRLLANIGMISADYLIMFSITAWLMSCAHFLRTGSRLSFWFGILAAALGVSLDRACLAVFFCLPCLLLTGFLYRRQLAKPVIRRLRGASRRLRFLHGLGATTAVSSVPLNEEGENLFARTTRSLRWFLGMEFPPAVAPSWRLNYQPGSLFRTLEIPFFLWAYWQRRWLRLAVTWLAAGLATALLTGLGLWALTGGTGFEAALSLVRAGALRGLAPHAGWLSSILHPLDLHLGASLVVVLLCALQSPAAGLPSFFEWAWVVLLALLFITGAVYLADLLDGKMVQSLALLGEGEPLLEHLKARQLTLWLEPTVLSFGVAGVYNLMKVLDTRIAQKL